MALPLRFGIPSVDDLFAGNAGLLGDLPNDNMKPESLSICIVGADGTGKSVLALHLAANYFAQMMSHPSQHSYVFYATTDLSFRRAENIWLKFGLGDPSGPSRNDPFSKPLTNYDLASNPMTSSTDQPHNVGPLAANRNGLQIPLLQYRPLEEEIFPQPEKAVYLVDLASTTAGDDWGLLNRLLAILEEPHSKHSINPYGPCHLLIVDAVEGLETLVGDKDAFGEERSRRSRIAQLLRTAKDKCHVVLIVEEPADRTRLPEEFVTDVVLHLRYHKDRDYVRRTLEIDKARGQSHARGQHDFAIRAKRGSKTGVSGGMWNSDDPPATHDYFLVFPSLHYLSRKEMRVEGTGSPPMPRVAGFGIGYLDNMLGRDNEGNRGLPVDAPTALFGEDGTFKSHLGRAFLSQCFATQKDSQWEVAVLLTTKDMDRRELVRLLPLHLPRSGAQRVRQLPAGADQRILCRTLEIHHLSSAVLMHIVQRLIERAQSILFGSSWKCDRNERRSEGHRIRFVIDNWTTIQNTFPEVRNDPLFLPFLINYLRAEGICTLIVATAEGGPNRALKQGPIAELRELTPHHLYTWHVPFFGISRVAITALPSIQREYQAIVRELRTSRGDLTGEREREALEVDPHFELYTGLDKGMPSFVPLRIHLFAQTEAFRPYLQEINEVLSRIIAGHAKRQVVIAEEPESYERLRDFSRLQRGTRLNHTLVFQVDEFWAESLHPGSTPTLRNQWSYLFGPTVTATGMAVDPEDPLRLFQPAITQKPTRTRESDGKIEGLKRHTFFHTVGHNYKEYEELTTVEKVPYFWDFGFLLCRQHAWQGAFDTDPDIAKVWHNLDLASALQQPNANAVDKKPAISWYEFLKACKAVAQSQARRGEAPPFPFDVSMVTPETLSCLVLEVWASEIQETIGKKAERSFPRARHCAAAEESLRDLVNEYSVQLYRTWLLLGEVFLPNQFAAKALTFNVRPAHASAIACRHWYSTAASAQAGRDSNDPLVPLGLPGTYTVRGDWFLAVARGSRSTRVGERAMDLLCSRRANIVRLQAGLGLPVRDLWDAENDSTEHGELWTPLQRYGTERAERITYRQIRALGARDTDQQGRPEFYWLWRSLIKHYDWHVHIWQRWLCDVISCWRSRLSEGEGFQRYEERLQKPKQIRKAPAGKYFLDMCSQLVKTLDRATVAG